jgi:hypothetical protein
MSAERKVRTRLSCMLGRRARERLPNVFTTRLYVKIRGWFIIVVECSRFGVELDRLAG